MKTPSVVIFDLGKVLVDFDYTRAGQRIAAKSKTPPEDVRKFIDHSPLLVRYESGQMTTAQFYAEVAAGIHFDGTQAEFAEFFADIFIPIPGMVELHAEVRRKGIPTFILSNTNELAVGHIRRNFPFFVNFDGYVLSYQVGAIKPLEKIYEAAEQLTGKSGAELLFIDDLKANIATAAARGWQVILQETPQKTRAELVRLGVL